MNLSHLKKRGRKPASLADKVRKEDPTFADEVYRMTETDLRDKIVRISEHDIEIEKAKKEDLGKEVGKVTHYFSNIGVAVIKLGAVLKQGDKIRVKGDTSDFTQNVDSRQIEHEKVESTKKGISIGMKVVDHAREHDIVYKV